MKRFSVVTAWAALVMTAISATLHVSIGAANLVTGDVNSNAGQVVLALTMAVFGWCLYVCFRLVWDGRH